MQPSETAFRLTELAPSPRRRWKRWWTPTLIVIAVLAIGVGGVLFWQRGASGSITLTGTVTITDDSLTFSGQQCQGDGGYSDMRAGTQVTVTDAAGQVVALGQLGQGTARGFGTCVWRFAVNDIPAGREFYGVEVSHRGVLRYAEADLDRELVLTLGT